MGLKRTSTTHEFSGSNLTVADFKMIVEEIVSLPEDARVTVTASEDQRDGNWVKFVITERP